MSREREREKEEDETHTGLPSRLDNVDRPRPIKTLHFHFDDQISSPFVAVGVGGSLAGYL